MIAPPRSRTGMTEHFAGADNGRRRKLCNRRAARSFPSLSRSDVAAAETELRRT
jgi:hypothetical protein